MYILKLLLTCQYILSLLVGGFGDRNLFYFHMIKDYSGQSEIKFHLNNDFLNIQNYYFLHHSSDVTLMDFQKFGKMYTAVPRYSSWQYL